MATTGELLQTFTGHSGSVWSLEWSVSGDRLMTGSGDSTVRIWDAETGVELLVYTFPDWPLAHWSPDNQQIACPVSNGETWIIDAHWQTPEELISYARECCVIRDLTPEEREQFGLAPKP